MQPPLLPDADLAPARVVMSLNPVYYALMWKGEKTHEFRRRYLAHQPTTWFVYLTAPVGRLAAVIDLAPAVEGTAGQIAAIAERTRPGNGSSVRDYLAAGSGRGYAMPIRRVREFDGFSAEELAARIPRFHPPQGYTLADRHPDWSAVCDDLAATPLVREISIEPASA